MADHSLPVLSGYFHGVQHNARTCHRLQEHPILSRVEIGAGGSDTRHRHQH